MVPVPQTPRDQLQTALAGRYAIERELGRGGMATVYLARDRKHERPVALKLLDPELGVVLGADRFLVEIRVTATLQHPNLLPLFDSGSAAGLLYYVMPYVEGESLRARLQRERQLPVDDAVRVAVAVADALDYAHSRGVVHRDLKPENILLQHGQPVVADFGIALAVSNAGGARVTRTGLSLGTPQYMSPEQAAGDRSLDGRTDVYSLAAVLYEMLAGEPPHAGGTVQSIIARVLSERPADVRGLRPSVPAHVAHAIDVALEKVPADRWPSAREFAEALQGRLTRDVVARASRPGEGAARGARARPWLAAAAIGALAAAAGAGWWRALRTPDGPLAFTVGLGPDVHLPTLWDFPLAVSRDGRTIAFVGRAGTGPPQLHVKRIDEVQPRLLTGTVGAERPVFSADGRSIAYVVAGELHVIPTDGGSSVPVRSGRAVARGWPPVGLAWTRDGAFVIAPNRASGLASVLHVLPRHGGRPRALTRLDSAAGEAEQRWPTALDDGRTILYTSYRPGNDPSQARIAAASLRTGRTAVLDLPGVRALGVVDGHVVFVTHMGEVRAAPVDLEGGRVKGPAVTLLDGVKTSAGPVAAALSPSGMLVYLAGNSRDQELVLVDQTGARRALSRHQDFDVVRASPDGRLIASEVDLRGSTEIWIHDRAAGTATTLRTRGDTPEPEWSPDGRWLYSMKRTYGHGADTLLRQPADGSAEPSTAAVARWIRWYALHPDGETMLYDEAANRADPARVRVKRLRGDTTSRSVAGFTRHEHAVRFSPDGRWIAFASTESGVSQVHVRPFPAPTPRMQVSTDRGSEPIWSQDGRRLYYRDAEHFVAAELSLGAVPIATRRTPLFRDEFDQWGSPAGYDVTRDGRFVVVRNMTERDRVVAIVHFDALVRARLREAR